MHALCAIGRQEHPVGSWGTRSQFIPVRTYPRQLLVELPHNPSPQTHCFGALFMPINRHRRPRLNSIQHPLTSILWPVPPVQIYPQQSRNLCSLPSLIKLISPSTPNLPAIAASCSPIANSRYLPVLTVHTPILRLKQDRSALLALQAMPLAFLDVKRPHPPPYQYFPSAALQHHRNTPQNAHGRRYTSRKNLCADVSVSLFEAPVRSGGTMSSPPTRNTLCTIRRTCGGLREA